MEIQEVKMFQIQMVVIHRASNLEDGKSTRGIHRLIPRSMQGKFNALIFGSHHAVWQG